MLNLLGKVWFIVTVWSIALAFFFLIIVNISYVEGRSKGWKAGIQFTKNSLVLKHAVQEGSISLDVAQDSLNATFWRKIDSLYEDTPWYINR